MSLSYQSAKEKIDAAQHILLLTDERIDGDTIGSTLGLYHSLKEAGKTVTVYSPKPLPDGLAFIPGVEVIVRDREVFTDPTVDLMIISDCSDGLYLKDLPVRKVPLIVFDHHVTNPRFGTINVIEPESASTADVVWRFLKFAGMPINKQAAQCILTGILTDTGVFSTGNTTSAALEAAHDLVLRGANLQQIVRLTMMNRSVPALQLWGLALSRLYQDKTFDALTTAITRVDLITTKATEDDLEGLSNFLSAMVEGADTVLVLRETSDNCVKGSLRSHTRDVALLATKNGGGGHKHAAGFKVEHSYLKLDQGTWKIMRRDAVTVDKTV